MKTLLMKALLLFFLPLIFTGCYQASSDGDDDLITIPVTNNPNLMPETGGFNPPGAMPY